MSYTATLVGSPSTASTAASFSATNNAANFGNCLSLNGSSQYATLHRAALYFGPNQSWTLRGRFRSTSATGTQAIFALGSTTTKTAGIFVLTASGVLKVSIDGINGSASFGTVSVADSAWHDFAVVMTNGTSVSLYVDGVLNLTGTGQYSKVTQVDNRVTIGAMFFNSATVGSFFAGQVDEFSIWDHTTAGTAITSPYGGTEQNLRALLHFDGNTDDSAILPRQFATNCGINTAYFAANKPNLMSRSHHWARYGVAHVQAAFANWYVGWSGSGGGSSTGEQPSGATYVFSASLEYGGASYPLTWDGASTVSVVSGATTRLSDPVAVTLPVGAEFYFRTYYTSSNSNLITAAGTGNGTSTAGIDLANGEECHSDTTNQTTATGSITGGNTITAVVFRPLVIASRDTPSDSTSFLLVGDSRVNGQRDAYTGTSSDRGETARMVGESHGYINLGVPGDWAGYFLNDFSRRLWAANFCSIAILEHGINDVIGGSSAATISGQQSSISVLVNLPSYQCTLPPVSTSTDSWATAGNQTTHATNAVRVALNGLIVAGQAGITGFIDINSLLENSPGDGKWKVNGSANYATDDGVHETTAGNVLIKTGAMPGAPTAVSAAAGDASAVVSYTPPASAGMWSIIDHLATSTPGSVTATGTSSPVTVAGLANGTAYTFDVKMRNIFGYGASSAASNSVTPTAPIPVSTAVPTLTGSAVQGQTLTASTGAWTNSPASYAYRWLRGASAISGATSSTYVLQAGDVGSQVRCGVIATNATGSSDEALSLQTAVVTASADTTAPTLTGSLTIGTVTSSSIQITWPAGADNLAVTSYETSPDGSTWTDRGGVLTYTFSGLATSTSYTLRVRAKDAAGNVSTPALSVTQSTESGAPPPVTTSTVRRLMLRELLRGV